MFVFLAILTALAYVASYFGIKEGGFFSAYIILGCIIIKLLFSLAFVIVYLSKFRVNSIYFAAEFFSVYFLFTAFEVYGLLCKLRHQNKR